ncbi:MAG: lysophospholipid acyltransferase family protein [Deltaproteobacteria bacterium]|nr:lysophospholipid acyltransferase family protein [Deltaproteobacteria bacterium]
MRYTIFDIPILRDVLQGLSICILRICGWRRKGRLPDIPKYVMIVAPHTSNWDMPIGMAIVFALKLKLNWLAKESLFRWPFGGLIRWLGGIPINRSKSCDVVARSIQTFKDKRKMVMVVAPEGTRKKANYWKTGFYHIAIGANVPIVMGFIDYARKVGGIGPTLIPTGNIEFDMQKIRCFYDEITGKIPDRSTPAMIAPRSG